MSTDITATGSPSLDELKASPGFPSETRIFKGPVAVIECVQEIPCDVCRSICPHDAINVPKVNSLPILLEEQCIGCGICLPFCPGLAIFLIDIHYSNTEALISFPYEFLPLPTKGSMVDATDRMGQVVTKGRIVRIITRDDFDKTVTVSIAVPQKYAQKVRGIRLPKGRDNYDG